MVRAPSEIHDLASICPFIGAETERFKPERFRSGDYQQESQGCSLPARVGPRERFAPHVYFGLMVYMLAKFTTDLDPTSRLKSVTQEGDLDEFFNTAQLAGTQFTAGTLNLRPSTWAFF
jgi:hypothetical protein